ncbi:unnamed protein product [Lactuca saligna]|uniref:Uncharacterized protein n=1 Tax=Lactuca saligna TaxID=75948 RepID=A0AA35ZEM9_LACSI|nr:unnamed protein product [Lactuca saligna]
MSYIGLLEHYGGYGDVDDSSLPEEDQVVPDAADSKDTLSSIVRSILTLMDSKEDPMEDDDEGDADGAIGSHTSKPTKDDSTHEGSG